MKHCAVRSIADTLYSMKPVVKEQQLKPVTCQSASAYPASWLETQDQLLQH